MEKGPTFVRTALLLLDDRAYDRLVPRRQQHLFRTDINLDRGVWTIAENGLASRIRTAFRTGEHFLFSELSSLG